MATDQEVTAAGAWCVKYRDLHELARTNGIIPEVTLITVEGQDGPDTARVIVKLAGKECDMGQPPPYAFSLLSKLVESRDDFQGLFVGPVDVQRVQ